MSIQLEKNGSVNLVETSPGLQHIAVALGWSSPQGDEPIDLDASVFMLGENGKVPEERFFVFYNNLESPDGAVVHKGDSLTGQESVGDDETIFVDLTKVDDRIRQLNFVVTIHESELRNQTFGMVPHAFIRIVDQGSLKELARFELKEIFSDETAVEFARLVRKEKGWKFQAIGVGSNLGLKDLVEQFCAEAEPSETQAEQSVNE